MSENNDGGLAERGGTSNVSGTGSNFGGSGGPTGSGGSNSGNVGQNMGTAGHGTSSYSSGMSNRNPVSGTTNFTSVRPWGELLPGARAPVVPGYGYAPRRDQTLGDIQEQNRIGNANYNAGRQNTGSNNAGSGQRQPQRTFRTITRRNPRTGVVERVRVPTEPIDAPLDPIMGAPPPTGIGLINPGQWPNTVNPQWPNNNVTPTPPGGTPNWGPPGSLGEGIKDESQVSLDHANGWGVGNSSRGGLGAAISGRQFGGPVEPGQQYTVGENGPETLQMGPGGGGQVIPHNPMDRLGTMSPQMMQQQFQLMKQQWKGARPDMSGLQGDPRQAAMQTWRDARPDRPQMPGPGQPPVNQPQPMPPTPQPPMAGAFDQGRGPRPPAMGQPQAGIGGLSRPQGGGGFGWGGNGFGQPGIAQHYGIR